MTFPQDLLAVALWVTILINVSCTRTELSTGCPERYRPFKTKCYKIYSNNLENVGPKIFNTAKSFCENEDANLVSIHSKEEQDFLTAYLGEPTVMNLVWIGLKKNIGRGQVGETWLDGSDDQNFRNFEPGEPNGGKSEPCFHLQEGDNVAGMWNDINCNNQMGFICQTDRIGNIDGPFLQDGRCTEGFSYYRNNCYRLERNEADFWTAESICENNYGGHLASIRDNYNEAFLTTMTIDVGGNVWIGFTDHVNDLIRGKFAWTDGSHVYHTHWNQSQPANSSGGRCVSHKGSGWAVEDCSQKLRFVCSKPLNEKDGLAKLYIGTCPDGWIDVQNQYCYYLETSVKRNYSSANSDCADKVSNGTLAMLESKHDLFLLRRALSNHLTETFALGIVQSPTNRYQFVLSNNKPVTYLPWYEHEPNNLKKEKCVKVNARTLWYINYECETENSYICQINKVVHQTIENGGVVHVTDAGSDSEKRSTSSPGTTSSGNSMLSEIKKDDDTVQDHKGLSQAVAIIIGIGVVLVALGLILTAYFVYRRRRHHEIGGTARFINETK